jgi:hypothetical protein
MNRRHIISASRRTDIPAFHAEWLLARIRAGSCEYPNPIFPSKRHRVSLRSEDVLGWVFWTRNAAPLMPYLPEFDARSWPYLFQYTAVGYPRSIDPRSPSASEAEATLRELSGRIGRERIVWRYDPILLSRDVDAQWHRDNFRRRADALASQVRHLVVSVIDSYAHTRTALAALDVRHDPPAVVDVLAWIAAEAVSRGLSVFSCAEPALAVPGIQPGRCVDAALLHTLGGLPPPARPAMHRQRKGCLCHRSVDIGTAGTCGFGCRYCYAAPRGVAVGD